VVGEEGIDLKTLLKVSGALVAANVLHEIEVAVGVNARADHSVPVNALQFDVGIVLLEGKVESFCEVNVRALDSHQVLTGHLKLVEVKILWENLHFITINNY